MHLLVSVPEKPLNIPHPGDLRPRHLPACASFVDLTTAIALCNKSKSYRTAHTAAATADAATSLLAERMLPAISSRSCEKRDDTVDKPLVDVVCCLPRCDSKV